MKALSLIRYRYLLFPYLFAFVPFMVFAQVSPSDPSGWDVLLSSAQNPAVRDTFLLQSFNGSSKDNWAYSVNGNTALLGPSDNELRNASTGNILAVYAEGEVVFPSFETSGYESLVIRSPYACYQVMPGEMLQIHASHETKPARDYDWLTPPQSYTSHFQEKKEHALYTSSHIHISGGYNSLSLKVGKATGASNRGFYAFDSVYVSGLIPLYSLFEGKGSWSDPALWSDNPAMRNRRALVKGEVVIDNDVNVNAVYLSSGEMTIGTGKSLKVEDLYLLDNSALYSSGELEVNGQLSVYLPPLETEKWYFLSFPFDVYAEGIDPRLQLRDDTETGTGPYFYLMSYDGEKRAATGIATNNWEVIPSSLTSGTLPVFEKNKGYLFALDKGAPADSLRFYAKNGAIAPDFGRTAKIKINVPDNTGTNGAEHSGWVLCGNPMPSPLPLSRIKENPDLDGYIYVYDGAEYKAYEIGSSYAIPAYGAFFVKALQSTDIEIAEKEPALKYTLLSSPPIGVVLSEPSIGSVPTGNHDIDMTGMTEVCYEDGLLSVKNNKSNTVLSLYDLSGVCLLKRHLHGYDCHIPLKLKAGIYVTHINGDVPYKHLIMVR